MHIFIPSMRRSGEIGNGPLPMIPDALRSRTHYVVPGEEIIHYASSVSRHQRDGMVLACAGIGIARTRYWIGNYCANHNIKKFLMMDDDVKFIVRRAPDDWHLKPADQGDVLDMLVAVEKLLDDYGHVGIGTRQGNNNLGVGAAPLLSHNTRTLRCLAYRTADFLSVVHGRVAVMEDFDVNLQLLERGIPNCAVNYWCQDQKMTNAPGDEGLLHFSERSIDNWWSRGGVQEQCEMRMLDLSDSRGSRDQRPEAGRASPRRGQPETEEQRDRQVRLRHTHRGDHPVEEGLPGGTKKCPVNLTTRLPRY